MRGILLLAWVVHSLSKAARGLSLPQSGGGGGGGSGSRRHLLVHSLTAFGLTAAATQQPLRRIDSCRAEEFSSLRPFVYSKDWTGTALPVKSLERATSHDRSALDSRADIDAVTSPGWSMARWPDPVLRRPASPVSQHYFGTDTLEIACQLLQSTARKEKAVGLAAEQCGVDARIIYLENALHPTGWGRKSLVLVNPRIVLRAPETEMKVWKERCLVLPPTFVATVLRDAWVEVCYQQPESGAWRVVRLEGEPARAFQHEFDHDRGILITDHVSLEDMESELMASIEARGHVDRMRQAYSRDIQSILFESK